MWGAVGSGGAIAVEDADFDGQFCEPPNEAFAAHERLYRQVLEHRGGDPTFGRKLFGAFLEAGIPRPDIRRVQAVHSQGEAKTLATLTLQAIADAVVDEGIATPEQVDETLAGLEAFVADPETLVAQPRISRSGAGATSPDAGLRGAVRRSGGRRARGRPVPRTR